MAKYRHDLPQVKDKVFLTDSGLETTLIFHDGMDLPCFASFPLLDTEEGLRRLRHYYELHAGMAVASGLGFVLESVTWRAHRDWGAKLGYGAADLDRVNRDAIAFLEEIRAAHETPASPLVISGNLGPRGDGYDPGTLMSPREAEDYHLAQIATLADTNADFISAFTMNNVNEAIGIIRAAKRKGIPSVVSFTLETDGKLATGQSLKDAIVQADAETHGAAAYYMINCAHPTHFEHVLTSTEDWAARLRGIRANASRRSHAELDNSTDLDAGNPVELGTQYRDLRRGHRRITILGGCCGTDHRHVQEIARWCEAVAA